MNWDQFNQSTQDCAKGTRWTPEEDAQLRAAINANETAPWKDITAEAFPNEERTPTQCLHRWENVLKPGQEKGKLKKTENISWSIHLYHC